MSSGQGTGSEHNEVQPDNASATHASGGQPPESQASSETPPTASTPSENETNAAAGQASSSGGPLSIERIRQLRASQNPAPRQPAPGQRPQNAGKQQNAGNQPRPRPAQSSAQQPAHQAASSSGPASGQVTGGDAPSVPVASGQVAESQSAAATVGGESPAPSPAAAGTPGEAAPVGKGEGKRDGDRSGDRGRRRPFAKQRENAQPIVEPPMPKLEVPSRRAALSSDLQNEFEQALAGTDLERMLIGDAMVQVGRALEEGQRIQGRVIKVHGEHVFVSLGGPNEGVISILQFTEPPEAGAQLEVVVRGYLPEEGLYDLALPGSAVAVDDLSDIKEGEVVEAKVTAANAGGLECVVGHARGFIPASQVAEFRVEDFSEFIDQKVLCIVTQCNPARGNLVLSRRAVLERERAEKREQRLRELEVGSTVEGTVRKIMDFGAFVDIGGLDGLLHISQLSWEKIKHPSEVLEEGQKVQVRIDKFDAQSGKISLSYRSLQDHPWTNVQERFPAGAIVHGTVSRIADFGAFVRLATGVEGLVHLSELAHHRVHRISNVVQEGQEVDVKVLSVEPERQRMSLSLKAAQQPPAGETATAEPEEEEAPRELALPKHRGPLKGGTTRRGSNGDQFGLKW